jgi:hypothetical protein
MDPIFSQHAPITPPDSPGYPEDPSLSSTVPAPRSRDRIDRLSALTPEDNRAGLIWLALHLPAACDAVLDALEHDEEEEASPDPEPYCAICGVGIGIFLRFGLDWRHFRGEGAIGQIELFDAGHAPVIAWRPSRATITR